MQCAPSQAFSVAPKQCRPARPEQPLYGRHLARSRLTGPADEVKSALLPNNKFAAAFLQWVVLNIELDKNRTNFHARVKVNTVHDCEFEFTSGRAALSDYPRAH
jgi:hypothetical protein